MNWTLDPVTASFWLVVLLLLGGMVKAEGLPFKRANFGTPRKSGTNTATEGWGGWG